MATKISSFIEQQQQSDDHIIKEEQQAFNESIRIE
jgi:hypothetical protein